MSKLSKNVETFMLNRQANTPTPLQSYSLEIGTTPCHATFDRLTEYRFEARLGVTTMLNKGDPGAVGYALDNIKQAIVNEIYGDIRHLLIKLQVELYQHQNSINYHNTPVADLMNQLLKETEV